MSEREFRKKRREWLEERGRRLTAMLAAGEIPFAGCGSPMSSVNRVVAQRIRREGENSNSELKVSQKLMGNMSWNEGNRLVATCVKKRVAVNPVGNMPVTLIKETIKSKSQLKWEHDRICHPVEEIKFKPAKATELRIYRPIDFVPEKREDPEVGVSRINYICDYTRDKCKDCRDVFSEICRFNNTLSFWKSNK